MGKFNDPAAERAYASTGILGPIIHMQIREQVHGWDVVALIETGTDREVKYGWVTIAKISDEGCESLFATVRPTDWKKEKEKAKKPDDKGDRCSRAKMQRRKAPGNQRQNSGSNEEKGDARRSEDDSSSKEKGASAKRVSKNMSLVESKDPAKLPKTGEKVIEEKDKEVNLETSTDETERKTMFGEMVNAEMDAANSRKNDEQGESSEIGRAGSRKEIPIKEEEGENREKLITEEASKGNEDITETPDRTKTPGVTAAISLEPSSEDELMDATPEKPEEENTGNKDKMETDEKKAGDAGEDTAEKTQKEPQKEEARYTTNWWKPSLWSEPKNAQKESTEADPQSRNTSWNPERSPWSTHRDSGKWGDKADEVQSKYYTARWWEDKNSPPWRDHNESGSSSSNAVGVGATSWTSNRKTWQEVNTNNEEKEEWATSWGEK